MSTHRVRKRRQAKAEPPRKYEPDTTELELRELFVLWPRLEAALGSDGSGPSAAPSGGSGSSFGSPAVIDLDTERVRTLVALGVHEVEAEAIRLLNITPGDRVLAGLRTGLADQSRRTAEARAALPRVPLGRGGQFTVEQNERRSEVVRALVASIDETAVLRARVRRVEYRRSTLGVIEMLPTWYAKLRDRKQPLAANISRDVARWCRDARSALRLRTREMPIGWTCPHHRDEPAELIRDRDEAILDDAVLAGRRPAEGIAPLKWKFAEAVHCPKCDTKWVGVEQLRVLMLMIERAELEEFMTEAMTKALDDEHLKTTLWQCGECGKTSSREAWATAWWAERGRRMAGEGIDAELLAEFKAEGTASKYGLEDCEVCPRCKYVHCDNDGPGVLEVAGVAVALP